MLHTIGWRRSLAARPVRLTAKSPGRWTSCGACWATPPNPAPTVARRKHGMRKGMPDMDETSLRRLLDSALVGRPPMGPVVHNALRAGLKLRRRRRIQGAAGGAAAIAIIAVTIPATIGILGHTPGPAAGHRSAGLAGGPKFFAGITEKPLGQDPRI